MHVHVSMPNYQYLAPLHWLQIPNNGSPVDQLQSEPKHEYTIIMFGSKRLQCICYTCTIGNTCT